MQTPYEYKKLIKQRILTEQIIMECICRVNERIKNCRDKLQKYKNDHYFDYEIKQIDDDFYTYGMQTANLLSVQFVNKVLSLIKSSNYTYQKIRC